MLILSGAHGSAEVGIDEQGSSHEPVAVAAVVLCTVSASAMPPASGGGEAMITGKETHEAPTLAGQAESRAKRMAIESKKQGQARE